MVSRTLTNLEVEILHIDIWFSLELFSSTRKVKRHGFVITDAYYRQYLVCQLSASPSWRKVLKLDEFAAGLAWHTMYSLTAVSKRQIGTCWLETNLS